MKKFILAVVALLYSFVGVNMVFAAADTWTQKADFGGTARIYAVGFSIGSKGYIGMGWVGSSCPKDFWEYDPATDTWTQKANFGGTAREAAVGFSIGSKGYIGVGFDGATNLYYKDFWEYDPASNIWTQKADFGGGVRNNAVGFSIGSKGYIGTGAENSSPYKTKDFWEYDPATDTWTQKADFGGVARYYATGFSIGNKGYIGTGWDRSSNKNDFWEYEPNYTITLIDFERPGRNYSTLELAGAGLTYSEDGYTLTDVIGPEEPYPLGTYMHYVGGKYRYPPCSVAMGSASGYATITLTRDNGKPFSIAGIALTYGARTDPQTVLFTGTKATGDIVTHSFTFVNRNGVEFFIFPQSFSNLVSVQFHPTYSFDNLVVFESPVTEPDHQNIAYDTWATLSETCRPSALPDTTPDRFALIDQTDVSLITTITSNTIRVSGINTPAPIAITGGKYSINGGAYTDADGTVSIGDKITIQLTSSWKSSTTMSATLTIGGVSDTFSVTTLTVSDSPGGPGGCFIATAAFGSPLAGQVEILRQFRDRYLLTNNVGKKFVAWYYRNGPAAANYMNDKPLVKAAVRAALYPLIGFSLLLISGCLPFIIVGLLLSALLFLRFRMRKLSAD